MLVPVMWSLLEDNWPSVVGALIGSMVFFTSLLVWYNHNKYQYFVKLGIKGPKPSFLLGNIRHVFSKEFKTSNFQYPWFEQYGKLYGVYFGTTPHLIISDAEVINQICVKDFDSFANHKVHDLMIDYQQKWLIFLQDDEWRRVRALMTPTFTSGKIKRMYPIMDNCSDELIDMWKEQMVVDHEHHDNYSAIVDVKEAHGIYTLDAIATCCFGLKFKRAQGAKSLNEAASRDEIAKILVRFFDRHPYRFIISKLIPLNILRLFGFKAIPRKQFDDVATIAKRVIDTRRKSGKKFEDYLQLLIDARLDDKLELNQMDKSEIHHVGLNAETLEEDQRKLVEQVIKTRNSKVTLSDFELLSEAMLLLIVGMETTANMLTNCVYTLAYHPEVQQKLYETVKPLAKYDANNKLSFDYDDITSCKYLDAVISETLRRLPIITMIDRVAARDYYVEKYDVVIPKDMQLFISYYSTLMDPDYWDEPQKFNPERFMPENRDKIVPGSYIPFGTGPRHCIGMRFSLTESKLAMAKSIMNFKFYPVDRLSFPPEMGSGLGIAAIKDPRVKVMLR